MSRNNELYKMYTEMIEGYKKKQEGLFEHGARSWMMLEPENPFPPEDPAFEQFFLMQKGFQIWQRGGADRKINRRRMLEAAYNLCALNPKRPYKFDKKADEEEKAALAKAEEEKAQSEETVVKTDSEQNSQYVFGIVPDVEKEKKTNFLRRLFRL